jgi:hypothetical protein
VAGTRRPIRAWRPVQRRLLLARRGAG